MPNVNYILLYDNSIISCYLRVIKLNECNSLLLIIKYMKKYNLKLVNTINFINI